VSAFDDVAEFVRASKRTTEMAELGALLVDAVGTFGFDHVALVHHVDLSNVVSAARSVQFINYPDSWRALIRARAYYRDDPVLTAVQRSVTGFLWSDLPKIVPLSARQAEILATASACGLGEGFTVPINVPGEFLGSCSFAMRLGRDLRQEILPAAQYVGCFAFEAARRISASHGARGVEESFPQLTARQFDCVVLVAQGKSDWHIGQLLGISQETVHQHIEAAKKRYQVASRTQLVVRALFDSQITFADVLKGRDSP